MLALRDTAKTRAFPTFWNAATCAGTTFEAPGAIYGTVR